MSDNSFLSPITFAGYEIRQLAFEVESSKKPDGRSGDLTLGVEVTEDEDATEHVLVELAVLVNADPDSFDRNGYRVSARIAGFFVLDFGDDSDMTDEEQRSALLLNASALLYSTARTLLTGLARQSSLRDFTLPTVNMREFLKTYAKTRISDSETRV